MGPESVSLLSLFFLPTCEFQQYLSSSLVLHTNLGRQQHTLYSTCMSSPSSSSSDLVVSEHLLTSWHTELVDLLHVRHPVPRSHGLSIRTHAYVRARRSKGLCVLRTHFHAYIQSCRYRYVRTRFACVCTAYVSFWVRLLSSCFQGVTGRRRKDVVDRTSEDTIQISMRYILGAAEEKDFSFRSSDGERYIGDFIKFALVRLEDANDYTKQPCTYREARAATHTALQSAPLAHATAPHTFCFTQSGSHRYGHTHETHLHARIHKHVDPHLYKCPKTEERTRPYNSLVAQKSLIHGYLYVYIYRCFSMVTC